MGFGWCQEMGKGLCTVLKCVGTARSQPDCSPQPSASQGHSHCSLEAPSSWFMTQLLTEFLQQVPLCKPHLPKPVPTIRGQQKVLVFPRSL